jgi:hypothetical protein
MSIMKGAAILAALVSTVAAHGIISGIEIDGKAYGVQPILGTCEVTDTLLESRHMIPTPSTNLQTNDPRLLDGQLPLVIMGLSTHRHTEREI